MRVRVSPWLVLVLVLGCGRGALPSTPLHFEGGDPLIAEGFGACAEHQPASIALDSDQPLVVIVHGCLSSGREFKKLAEVFEFHGQQTVCFNYEHRRTLRGTAWRLRKGLDALRQRVPEREITLLGHSQGGLVSRIALAELEDEVMSAQHDLRLVTVSSPFSGIHAARHCGWPWLHVLSLGITVAVCQGIAGANWIEIHPGSRYWTEPRSLDRGVREHLQIVTDEEGTCRRRDEEGECEEDDLVFTLEEQENPHLDDARVHTQRIRAGHAAVVGSGGVEPRALIRVLQENEVLAPTPHEREAELAELVDELFELPAETTTQHAER